MEIIIGIKVKKLHKDAKMPEQANAGDAGYDIFAIDDGVQDRDGKYVEYDTGIAIAPEEGYHIKLCPRSSISKYNFVLANSEGLVDNSYRGPLKLRFKIIPNFIPDLAFNIGDIETNYYKKGDKIAQIKVEKTINANFEEVDELPPSGRGSGGFGSSGN